MSAPRSARTLDHRSAVRLAVALAADVAAATDARALLIKGMTLEHHGLRAPRLHADVDLLVEPAAFERVVAAFAARGWSQRFERHSGRVLADHSVTLVHPGWPCDIDVHRWFPGMFAAHDAAFDALWEHRHHVTVAHREIVATDFAASALIGLLHAARHRRSNRHAQERHSIVEGLMAARVEDRAAFLRLAEECGALPVLERTLAAAGLPVPAFRAAPRELAAWNLYTSTHEAGSTSGWLLALRSAAPRERLPMLWYALYPSAADIDRLHGASIGATSRARFRATRLVKAARALPGAVDALARARSGR